MKNNRTFRREFWPLLLCALLSGPISAQAASPAGTFAIKGIGLLRCDSVVKEFEAGSPNAMMMGGWIYGYLTGMNQTAPDTFELAPWQDLNTLTNYVVTHCRKNTQLTLAQSVFALASALQDKRLKAETKPMTITVNGRSHVLYAETVNRMTAELRRKGYLKGDATPEPEWNPEVTAAVRSFQAKQKLKVTGEPDQLTLHALLQR